MRPATRSRASETDPQRTERRPSRLAAPLLPRRLLRRARPCSRHTSSPDEAVLSPRSREQGSKPARKRTDPRYPSLGLTTLSRLTERDQESRKAQLPLIGPLARTSVKAQRLESRRAIRPASVFLLLGGAELVKSREQRPKGYQRTLTPSTTLHRPVPPHERKRVERSAASLLSSNRTELRRTEELLGFSKVVQSSGLSRSLNQVRPPSLGRRARLDDEKGPSSERKIRLCELRKGKVETCEEAQRLEVLASPAHATAQASKH